MGNKITFIVNAGRSGSSFLSYLLEANYSEQCYIAHEDIPVQVSKPRLYNRAYSSEQLNAIYDDAELVAYIKKWKQELKFRPVIETGWTSYHLLPFMHDYFKDDMQIVIMHRDPISFAFSRANMGNYHKNTFYDEAHEVSPFDPRSIHSSKKAEWGGMNHFEKCMFWWWTVYAEAEEFLGVFPQVPHMHLKSKDLFSFDKGPEIFQFLNLDYSKLNKKKVDKNPLAQFMRESFPVNEEWRAYKKQKDILDFAEKQYGYQFDQNKIEELSKKYKLPKGLLSKLRNNLRYWYWKSRLKRLLDSSSSAAKKS